MRVRRSSPAARVRSSVRRCAAALEHRPVPCPLELAPELVPVQGWHLREQQPAVVWKHPCAHYRGRTGDLVAYLLTRALRYPAPPELPSLLAASRPAEDARR